MWRSEITTNHNDKIKTTEEIFKHTCKMFWLEYIWSIQVNVRRSIPLIYKASYILFKELWSSLHLRPTRTES